ncbi:MarR family winged helix-turn-helix transcriptional regulator [Microbacterium sp. 18062]|uniref:MarR family winged helix-turn-helix transcriptional regulator n=1 Tax=Microbacterium sp. 18062 TaxID=2681410 RepID=UPI00135C0E97|nr:MarR family transcriptional regulator [Microbacterium sp. 18062]
MADRISFTLQELVSVLDAHADVRLRAAYGLSIGDFIYLATIDDLQPVDITTLAGCLNLSKAAVSKRMPILAGAGWITTSADPDHGRRVIVTLTERGATVVRDAGDDLDGEVTGLFSDPRLQDDGFDPVALNRHLETLIALVREKGTP